jgi:transcription elongation factor Elf1
MSRGRQKAVAMVDTPEDRAEERREETRTKRVVRWIPPPKTCPCPDCGSQNTRTQHTEGDYRWHVCRDCGLKFNSYS